MNVKVAAPQRTSVAYSLIHDKPLTDTDVRVECLGCGWPMLDGQANDYDVFLDSQVGISAFVSDEPGFTGVIKQRFEDFQVAEVDPNGKLVVLTDTTIPVAVCVAGKDGTLCVAQKQRSFLHSAPQISPKPSAIQRIWKSCAHWLVRPILHACRR